MALSRLVELLSSMRFAIALFTLVCIAAGIGTVVKQHEPLSSYVNQFGPFWSEVFARLNLYTIYSTWWFLLIVGTLVLSTSLCIARSTPKIFADFKAFKENIREQSLKAFGHKAQASLAEEPQVAANRIGQALLASGWKVKLQSRETPEGQGWMLAAKTGMANKIGYLAAHGAIVLICLGGLLDGDLIVRAQTWFNGKSSYTGGGLISEVPAEHRLSVSNPTFRGNLMVAEGTSASTAILSQPDGVLLQELPFDVELKKFVVEYYETGMPKLFASDILIHDHDTGETIPARVEVNRPVSHRGINIFQSSFDDGGSQVRLKAYPMGASMAPFDVTGVIGGSTGLSNGDTKLSLEFTGLRVINVENFSGMKGSATDVRKVDLRESIESRLGSGHKTVTEKKLRNVGPSITYKLRDSAGQAVEYHNYMLPLELDGSRVFMLGARESQGESMRYLRIPVDENDSLDGFMRLRSALGDPVLREEAIRRYAVTAVEPGKPELVQALEASARRVLGLFAGVEAVGGMPEGGELKGGLPSVSAFLEANVPEAERERAGEVLVRILNGTLFELAQLGRQRAGLAPLEMDERSQTFLRQVVLALSDSLYYPAPMTFQLTDFKQVQASVFQVARAPGQVVVYLGCVLLIVGVFAMLYVRERRVWVWLQPAEGGASLATMAMSTNRKTMEADQEFESMKSLLSKVKP